ncbi:hypothetical protein K458DRAFT_430861 [Lentithecium fluviatile CBS 122367]|uniref:Uncharacterized protein n=1 Tax=Lentithecium fluviatile CBS 122367 TaxID=1168545 RepID=A0A6G1J534_9PLEO|nr:hypothetical protein K458DRAFT_430861 [Lentithecium fluviatile CBS 122367]
MLFKAFVAFSLVLAPTSAVSLIQYLGPDCTGTKRICANIRPNLCCQCNWDGYINPFVSGRCQGCTSTDSQNLWRSEGKGFCESLAFTRNGGDCQGEQHRKLFGHSWLQNRKMSASEDAQCTGTVAPDLITRDDVTFFRIGEGVPLEDEMALEEWLTREVTVEEMPEHLLKYRTGFNATEAAD